MDKKIINNRVLEAIDRILRNVGGMSKAALAKDLGVTPSKFSEILKTRMMAGTEVMAALVEKFNISPMWLLTGKGKMMAPDQVEVFSDRICEILTDLTDGWIGNGVAIVAASLGWSTAELINLTNGLVFPTTPPDIAGFIKTYPEINHQWLLTGKGKPYIGDADAARKKIKDRNYAEYLRNEHCHLQSFPLRTDRKLESQEIPLYDLSAAAGLVAIFNDGYTSPEDYLRVPNLPPVDGAIYVRGESMTPLLKSGDIIIYKRLELSLDSILWGQIYLLSFDAGGDTFTVVKYIQKSDIPGCIRLVSHNDRYEPKDIPLSSIRAIAIVKASITFHTIE